MKSWIITGGVACGKSSFARFLVSQLAKTAHSFSGDDEVNRLLQKRHVLEKIADTLGSEVMDESGQARRSLIRSIIFNDSIKRAQLESLLHPLVLSALEHEREAARGSGAEVFLAEVPLHYEIGATVRADLTIVVAASQAMQIRRLMEIRGLDQDTILRMLGAQWTIEAKVGMADVVIWNDGGLKSLTDQALTLCKQIRQA
jgi:dephospho-CoA kinase